MCLAVPMKVIEIDGNEAKVEVGGTMRTVSLDIIDPPPEVGDYVIVHAGFVINIIDEEEAQTILHDFEILFGEENETSV
jgi:hydrogenase expression/formation protein HypC